MSREKRLTHNISILLDIFTWLAYKLFSYNTKNNLASRLANTKLPID